MDDQECQSDVNFINLTRSRVAAANFDRKSGLSMSATIVSFQTVGSYGKMISASVVENPYASDAEKIPAAPNLATSILFVGDRQSLTRDGVKGTSIMSIRRRLVSSR